MRGAGSRFSIVRSEAGPARVIEPNDPLINKQFEADRRRLTPQRRPSTRIKVIRITFVSSRRPDQRVAKHVFLFLTAAAVVVMIAKGGENPQLALQYSFLAIIGAFASGFVMGSDS